MAERLWARVDVAAASVASAPYRAWEGAPGGERRPLPRAAVLVIDERPDGVFLIGYDGRGAFAGDTWHRDFEEAKAQASFAYGSSLGPWEEIPPDAENAAAYALEQLRGG